MVNDNLRQALGDAGIGPDELAAILKVDDRTVRRWLAGGLPYSRHRAKLARALDRPEADIWPELSKTADAKDRGESSDVVDEVAAYAYHDLVVAPQTVEMIAGAREQIDLLDDDSDGLLNAPGLTDLLIAKADAGCRVRILICEPFRRSLGPLLNRVGLEIRLTEIPELPASHRADDQTLAWFLFYSDDDRSDMLLHISHDSAPGLFARLADRYQQLWDAGDPVQSIADINYYRTDRELGDEDDDGYDDDERAELRQEQQDLAPAATPVPQLDPQQPAAPSPATSALRADPTAPRRWPGRPA